MPSDEIELNTLGLDSPKKKKKKFNFEEFIYKYRFVLTLVLVGAILIGIGVIVTKSSYLEEPKIEVLEVPDATLPTQEIVVEIAGAVQKPGVYKFSEGTRVEDLLIASGGFSADADRDWIAKMVNRAAKLRDGQKIYIPKAGETESNGSQQSDILSAKNEGENKVYQWEWGSGVGSLVNINTASQKELEGLPGIGPVYAQSIIEHRPYSTVEELVEKDALRQYVFEKIKDLVTVY